MLSMWIKSLCTQFLISLSCMVVLLAGHYLSYLVLLLNRASPTDGEIDYLATLERDLDKITAWLPLALSQMVQSYFRHSTHIQSATRVVLYRAASFTQTCLFNQATGLAVSWVMKLSILCGYLFISGIIMVIAGPFFVKICIWTAVGINVVVHLCGDVGVFLTRLLLSEAERLRMREDATATQTSEGHDHDAFHGNDGNDEEGLQSQPTLVTTNDNAADRTETEQPVGTQLHPDTSPHDHDSRELHRNDDLQDHVSMSVPQPDGETRKPRSSDSFIPEIPVYPRTRPQPHSLVSPSVVNVRARKRSSRKHSLEDDGLVSPKCQGQI